MNEATLQTPYCGLPPLPAEIWSRWNLDPILLMVLAAWLVIHLRSEYARIDSPQALRHRHRFVQGWFALLLGLVSPLCALSVALFSARVSQHLWLALVAAPLLALGGALHAFSGRRSRFVLENLAEPITATAIFAIMLWVWHLPVAYQATFDSAAVYWLMHLTLTGSAVLLWHALLLGDRATLLARFAGGFFTLLQMGFLGAIITLAQRSLYPAHALTTELWGLTVLQDQQLGGLIMWVPGCIGFGVFLLFIFMQSLQRNAPAGQLGEERT